MRLRAGELIAAAAAIALFIVLSLNWTTVDGGNKGWSSLWLGTQLLVDLAIIFALAIPIVIATRQTVAAQMVTTTVGTIVSLVTVVALAITVLNLARDDDKLGPVGLHWPAYAGVALSVVLFAGVWRSLSDERLDAPGSEYTPPEARPAPPA